VSQFDLIIRGGTLVTHEHERVADLGIADGKMAALAPGLEASASEVVDAAGLHIFPGLIDSHVQFASKPRQLTD